MFTGLVERVGRVCAQSTKESLLELGIEGADLSRSLRIGDSVAVSGVCLTATRIEDERFFVDVAAETQSRTTLGSASAGTSVNLELPLRPTDRLGGHFVQGHVDAVGEVLHAGQHDGNYVLRVGHDPRSAALVVEKGSITLDGVSLTVTASRPSFFEVMLIPHTLEVTTLGGLAVGGLVNVEYDILAKYVARLSEPYREPS